MGDTLRSIVEKWRMIAGKIDDGTHTSECGKRACDFRSRAAELATLLAEYEKVDLVKRLRTFAAASGNADWSDGINRSADELETWLAVNLERIRAEALAALEAQARLWNLKAQAKKKPSNPNADTQEGLLHKLTKEEVRGCAENPGYEEEP